MNRVSAILCLLQLLFMGGCKVYGQDASMLIPYLASSSRATIPAFTNTLGLAAWWDRSNLTAGAITSWPDSSGAGRNLVSTGTLAPTGAVCAAGGYQAEFDGVEDAMTFTPTLGNAYNSLYIFTFTRPATNSVTLAATSTNTTTRYPFLWASTKSVAHYWGESGASSLGSPAITGRIMVAVMTQTNDAGGQNIYFYTNGVLSSTNVGTCSVGLAIGGFGRRTTTYNSSPMEDCRMFTNRFFTTGEVTTIMGEINASFGTARVW